jgi:CIC family chloride channel protein
MVLSYFSGAKIDGRSGKIFTNKHDKNILFSLKTEEFIDRYSQTILENAPIEDLFELVKNGDKNIFAIVDEQKYCVGF